MAPLSTISEKDIGRDGRLRRKYEPSEEAEGWTGTRMAGGLLLANAVLVIKSVFFGATDAAADAVEKDNRSARDERTDVTESEDGQIPSLKLVHNEEPSDNDDSGKTSEGKNTGSRFPRPEADDGPGNETTGDPAPVPRGSHGTSASTVVPLPIRPSPGAAEGNGGPAPSRTSSPSAGSSAPGSGSGGTGGPRADSRSRDRGSDDEDAKKTANRLPVVTGPVILSELYVNQSVIIGMSDLLRGATDPDGDALQARNVTASSGTLVDNADGTWSFAADADDTSDVTFTYEVTDAEAATPQVAFMDLLPLPGEDIVGTDAGERIAGTPGVDRIEARGGDDIVIAREDDDIIDAGPGNDRVVGGLGDDVIKGGAGNDVIFGGAGDDVIFGGDGDDVIAGDGGNDTLFGDAGDDTVLGGDGDDRAIGGDGDDVVQGDAGADLVDGGPGSDTLFGGDDNDTIIGGTGADEVFGGGGDDTVIAGAGDDAVHGDAGADLVDGGAGSDTLSGGDDNDTIIGGTGSDEVFGGGGDDTVIAGDGDDVVDGGSGDDVFIATASDDDDTYDGGDGSDTYDISSTAADATIDLMAGIASSPEIGEDIISDVENAIGGSGNDVIVTSEVANSLTGNAGHDVFVFHQGEGSKSGKGGHLRHRIEDFEVGDIIDLSGFDGDVDKDGWQQLNFRFDQASFDGVGQAIGRYEDREDGDYTLVRINFEDDGKSDDDDEVDYEISLVGHHELTDDNVIT